MNFFEITRHPANLLSKRYPRAVFPLALLAIVIVIVIISSCSSSPGTHLAYISAGQNVFTYRINNKSGNALTVVGSPFGAGISPFGIVVLPSNNFAYVANQGENTISLFKVDSASGSLTEVLPRTPAGVSPGPMVTDSSGSFLFVANQGSNDISVFSIGASGALSAVGIPVSVGGAPTGLT